MSKVKINVASGGVIEKPIITCFQGTQGNYVVLDNEANGSMGLPIICICKFDGTKLIKIIDNNEWAGVKGDLKTIISGSNFPYLNVPETLDAADDFYTQLTLPVASFDLLKNAYVPINAAEAPAAEAAPAEVAPVETPAEAPAEEAAPVAPEASVISDPSALGSIAPVETPAPVEATPAPTPAPEAAPVAPAEPATEVAPVEPAAPAVPEAPAIDIPTIPAAPVETPAEAPVAPVEAAPVETTPVEPAAPEISIPEMAAPVEAAPVEPTPAPSLPEIDVPVIGNGSVSEEPVSMMIPDPTATDVPVAPVTTTEAIAEPTQEMVNNTFVGESDDIETIKENFMKSCETMFDALIKKFQDK